MSEFKKEKFALSEEDLKQVSGGWDGNETFICWHCHQTITYAQVWQNNGACPKCQGPIAGD